uniref:ATP synthase subunit a n=1 Tax=Coleoptera sp. 1 AH-2016 TaxID=1903823 RepID=A0A343C2E3_9COLE|nr:ATP synthase F0 subunit 6 [Coleoptera sp. 1 AH-2016]
MMMNLFSSFDPSTSHILSNNWISCWLILLLIPPIFTLIPSRIFWFWLQINLLLFNELKILIKSRNYTGMTLLFNSLFFFILMNNFMGLFPYIFTCSSHMNFSIYLSLPLWFSFMLFGWIKNTMHMFAHLVPQGAPNTLLPFLVIIETTSNIIRPMTLAIRLTANMIAGHLLLTLLGDTGPQLEFFPLNILIFIQMLLLMLEFSVSIIQAYVFSILLTLYSKEVN